MHARLFSLALLAFSLGCSSAPPLVQPPSPQATPSTSAASTSPTSVAQAPLPPCAARSPRHVKVFTRTGSSIALVQDATQKLIYVADDDNQALHVLDAQGPTELAVVPLAGRPSQLLPLPDGRILVTLRDKNRLLAFEPAANPRQGLQLLCERPTYTEPFGLAVSADATLVAATMGWDHKLMLLDAQSLDTQRAINLPAEPRGVLFTTNGETAYVTHLLGGIVSSISLKDPTKPPAQIFVRPDRPDPPQPKTTKSQKSQKPEPKPINKTQQLAAAQGFAIAELSLGSEGERSWPGRLFVPMASSDPMRFVGENTFPGAYGGGGGGPAVIGAFVAVLDPITQAPLGGEVAPMRSARPEDCILPRGMAIYNSRLLVTCLGTDNLVELDARAVDPISAERRRFTVQPGPTGVAIDPDTGRAFVFSQWTTQLTLVDLGEKRDDTKVFQLAHPETPALNPQLARGRQLFHLTRDVRMSVDGRACASCHPDGRADGLTWATPDGPRQVISLAGRVQNSGPYGWFGDHPTVKSHVLFTLSRLRGLGFDNTPQNQEDFNALLAYLSAIPVPSREGALVGDGIMALRERGREMFFSQETGCSTCHIEGAGDGKRHDVGSGDPREKHLVFDTPALHLVAGSAPYFHDGRYLTLMDLLRDPKSKMGKSAHLSESDQQALVAYLETL